MRYNTVINLIQFVQLFVKKFQNHGTTHLFKNQSTVITNRILFGILIQYLQYFTYAAQDSCSEVLELTLATKDDCESC